MTAESMAADCQRLLPDEPAALVSLRAQTAALPFVGVMQAAPALTAFLRWLVGAIGAARVIEVGAFTGVTTLAIASALPDGGTVIALESDARWPAIGERHWRDAGCRDRIDLRIGDAAAALAQLAADGQAGSFDLVFVDANKDGYQAYLEAALPLLRDHGVIVFDNILFGGRVAGGAEGTAGSGPTGPAFLRDMHRRYADALRHFNERLRADDRVEIAVLPMNDGVTVARKQPQPDAVRRGEGRRA
jgi:O-methyltransferase